MTDMNSPGPPSNQEITGILQNTDCSTPHPPLQPSSRTDGFSVPTSESYPPYPTSYCGYQHQTLPLSTAFPVCEAEPSKCPSGPYNPAADRLEPQPGCPYPEVLLAPSNQRGQYQGGQYQGGQYPHISNPGQTFYHPTVIYNPTQGGATVQSYPGVNVLLTSTGYGQVDCKGWTLKQFLLALVLWMVMILFIVLLMCLLIYMGKQ